MVHFFSTEKSLFCITAAVGSKRCWRPRPFCHTWALTVISLPSDFFLAWHANTHTHIRTGKMTPHFLHLISLIAAEPVLIIKLQEHHISARAGAETIHTHQLTVNSPFHYHLVVSLHRKLPSRPDRQRPQTPEGFWWRFPQ